MTEADQGPGAAAARYTGRPVTGERPGSGALTEVVLDGGRVVMVKRGDEPGSLRAEAAGLRFAEKIAMPANNLCLAWTRGGPGP